MCIHIQTLLQVAYALSVTYLGMIVLVVLTLFDLKHRMRWLYHKIERIAGLR
jgi:hypothetical protein